MQTQVTLIAARAVLAFTCLLPAAHCAVLQQKNRVLTSALDEQAAPESPVARVALAPVAIPLGLTSLLVDGAFINPVRAVQPSLEIAEFVFTDVPFAGVGEIIVFPMRIITFPVLFVGAMIAHITLPIW